MSRRGKIWILTSWLGIVYGGWAMIVLIGGWGDVVAENWRMALAMAVGSYFAGSTPMGGGTVGFPVLTLMMGQTPDLGRDFSFAIQSVGMVSASVFIYSLSHPVVWGILRWALIGATLGTPLGILYIAPHIDNLIVQLFFAVIWAGFGLLHIWKLGEFSGYLNISGLSRDREMKSGLITGFSGGLLIASILGVGIDLALYAVLVLVFRCDLRLAIPSSVVLMAYTSVIGVVTRSLSGGLNPEVFGYWLAAAPVVAVGAPLGAIVVKKIGRKPTLWLVSGLCLLQLIWTIFREWDNLGWGGLGLTLASVATFYLLFQWLYQKGRKLKIPSHEGTSQSDQ